MNVSYRAKLGLSNLNPDQQVTKGELVINTMQASGNFTDIPISNTETATVIADYHNSILLAGTGASGTVSAMHGQRRIFISTFNFIRSYVERKANKSIDPKTIIESAGMTAYTTSGTTAVTELTLTAIGNGTVQVNVPRNTGEVAFIYEYSTDGLVWQEFVISKLATVELPNQTPASILYFRFAAIAKAKGAFSQSKSVIVL
jgi:hypothetical protein